MTIQDTLQLTGLAVAYSHFSKPKDPPYIVYIGSGQNTFKADNTFHWKENSYQIEYYFKKKNEQNEAAIEQALIDNGFLYEKSNDIYINSEDVYVIYYIV